MGTLRLGLQLPYWRGGPPLDLEASILEAERLGFDSVWSSEGWGADAITPLAWFGARTSMRLGTNIVQLSARTPAATAMAAMTMDHLSHGRFVLGLGASGPQVVEGWYGAPYPRPLERTREYVSIVRAIVAREEPVMFSGRHYTLPHQGGTGLGKPLKSSLHPVRDLTVFLGAEGPKNVALAAEIADGWLPFFLCPKNDAHYRACLAEGFARPVARRTPEKFEVVAAVPVVVTDDLAAGLDRLRPQMALYIGGMGAREANFHRNVFARLGYEDVCRRVTDEYLAGRRDEAIAMVPDGLIHDVALVGSPDRIRDELAAWRETVMTTMLVTGTKADLRAIAAVMA